MERYEGPPKILRLTGVSRKDLIDIEVEAENRLLEAAQDSSSAAPPEKNYPLDKIPRVFTDLENWPDHTNLRCWQCDFTFDERPKFVPTYARESENGGVEFGVLGNMCTFNCAQLWININYAGKDLHWRAQDNLCLVYFLFTGKKTSRILPAPNKTELKQYGGEMSEEAFWKKMRELDPVAGLRDYTFGSIIPERDRAQAVAEKDRPAQALNLLRVKTNSGSSCTQRVPGKKTVWASCGSSAAESPASFPRKDNVAFVAEDQLPAAEDQLPAAEDQLPAAEDQPPAAEDQLPAAEDQPPAAEDTESDGKPVPEIEAAIDLDEILGLPDKTSEELSNNEIDSLLDDLGIS